MSTAIFEPTRKLLENDFKTGWGSRTPIKFENAHFVQPANSAWVSFSIRWGVSDQISIGPVARRLERHNGAVIIQVFTPVNSGGKAMAEHCDFAAALFRMEQQVDNTAGINVVFRAPQLTDAGMDKELMQKNVAVPFQVDSMW